MASFRKRPIVIEAAQWLGFDQGPHDLGVEVNPILKGGLGYIDTLEGGHVVTPGDWIIIGIKGERYPCKPDIFEATYERVVSLQESLGIATSSHTESIILITEAFC